MSGPLDFDGLDGILGDPPAKPARPPPAPPPVSPEAATVRATVRPPPLPPPLPPRTPPAPRVVGVLRVVPPPPLPEPPPTPAPLPAPAAAPPLPSLRAFAVAAVIACGAGVLAGSLVVLTLRAHRTAPIVAAPAVAAPSPRIAPPRTPPPPPPAPAPPPVVRMERTFPATFAFNGWRPITSPAVVRRFAAGLGACVGRVRIEGHTDNVGDEAQNEAMGMGRADAVARLLRRAGASGPFDVVSVGATLPIADNARLAGRSKNRRVVVVCDVPAP